MLVRCQRVSICCLVTIQVGFAFRSVEHALTVIVRNLESFSGLAAETERLHALAAGDPYIWCCCIQYAIMYVRRIPYTRTILPCWLTAINVNTITFLRRSSSAHTLQSNALSSPMWSAYILDLLPKATWSQLVSDQVVAPDATPLALHACHSICNNLKDTLCSRMSMASCVQL